MKQLIILAVEDDSASCELIKAAFLEDGHTVHAAGTVRECRETLERIKPDIIILDRGLPDGDGLQLCLQLKRDTALKAIPILMLTGKAEVADKVLGLRYGADDYLAKPFDIDELRARVAAIVRRTCENIPPVLTRGGITIDLNAMAVTVKNRPVELTGREFDLLRFLMENPDTALTREALLAAVWKDAVSAGPKVVDVTLMNLRRKLGGAGNLICAVRSVGYKFASKG